MCSHNQKVRRLNISLKKKVEEVKNGKICPFCYLSSDEFVFLTTDTFYVIPSVGPLAEFHLLIVPFLCVPSMREIICTDGKIKREFCNLINTIVNKFVAIPGASKEILFFEHGRIGKSVEHAHMHFIYPFSEEEYHTLVEAIKGDFGLHRIQIISIKSYPISYRICCVKQVGNIFLCYLLRQNMRHIIRNITQ